MLVGLATIAGPILFIIPGIYIGSRSWELVGGHWWHAFGALVVAGLLTGVVNAVIRLRADLQASAT